MRAAAPRWNLRRIEHLKRGRVASGVCFSYLETLHQKYERRLVELPVTEQLLVLISELRHIAGWRKWIGSPTGLSYCGTSLFGTGTSRLRTLIETAQLRI